MKRVLLVATVQSHIGQFHRPLAMMLKAHSYEVHVAARNNLDEKDGLELDFADRIFDIPFARSPLSKTNINAYRMVKKIIDEGDYEYVHVNTPSGGIVGRLAARDARNRGTTVIYTAHGFHFFKGAPFKNWLIYYPIEKIMSGFNDRLVTITAEDKKLADRKNFKGYILRIHGVGVDDTRYYPADSERRKSLRMKENIDLSSYVLLCVGELNDNKNQKILLSALSELKKEIPDILLLIAGNGPNEESLKKQAAELSLGDNVRFLGYRKDLENITPSVDLAVSCSFREGLPLNILEAMLSKVPVVASVNRGHRELISDGKTGFMFNPSDCDELIEKILKIYNDEIMASSFKEAAYMNAKLYTASNVMDELENVYNI